jgi:hypothetical protein
MKNLATLPRASFCRIKNVTVLYVPTKKSNPILKQNYKHGVKKPPNWRNSGSAKSQDQPVDKVNFLKEKKWRQPWRQKVRYKFWLITTFQA